MIHPKFEKAIAYALLIICLFLTPIIFGEKNDYEYAKPYIWIHLLFLLILNIDFLLQILGRLYGFSPISIVARLFMQYTKKAFTLNFPLKLLISFYLTVCFFGLIYLHLGYSYPDSFVQPYEISYIKATYYSLTTLTVGPSGLEPKSTIAYLLIMAEILTGVFYAILVFSTISSHILQNKGQQESNS